MNNAGITNYSMCFLFTFFILPIGTSIFYSFTYYNILEPARFVGMQNYINLVLQDEVLPLYSADWDIELLERRPIPPEHPGYVAGVSQLDTAVYVLRRR